MASFNQFLNTYLKKKYLSKRLIASGIIAAIVLAPLIVVLSFVFSPTDDIWDHLLDTVLVELLINTFWLILGVGAGTAIIGTGLAWLTVVYDFPGRKIFDWALVLPLAIPAYVIAFVSIGLLDFTGPIQTQLRLWLGTESIWFPNIRSTGGVIAVMTLSFYPYVYLLARNAFLTQGRRGLEVAQSLGYSRTRAFLNLNIPMARPWIVAGMMLVLMETLADFGTVATFNFDTFTTAIYKAWFGFFSISAAAQLSSILVVIVFLLLLIEQRLRHRSRYTQVEKQAVLIRRTPLHGISRWLAFFFAFTFLAAGFLAPLAQLFLWARGVFSQDFDERYLGLIGHSIMLGGLAAFLTTACALVLVNTDRRFGNLWSKLMTRFSTLGYALPGAVLAVGGMILTSWIDKKMIGTARLFFGLDLGLIITGTIFTMLLAYLARFLVVAHSPIETAMQRITPSIDEAARGLGVRGMRIVRKIHIPILKGGLLTGIAMVFVDVMKEMPITLMTRPFGWDTLSVRIFEMTSEGQWDRAALPAVVLVLTGLIPVILLTRQAAPNN